LENIFRNKSDNYSCSYKGSRFINCKGNNDNSYSSKKLVANIKIFGLLIIMIILLVMDIKIIVIQF